MVTETKSNQRGEKVFSGELSSKQISETEKTESMTPEEKLEVFKKEFYEELSKINNHRTVSNMAINISEDAFKKMKEDPQYKQQILNLIQRDWGDSYAPRNCSVLITVGSSLNDYRADSWPVGYDSEFDVRSKNSFYKKTSESKKDKQKELLEEYLEKRQVAKRIAQETLDKKLQKEDDMREALRKSDAEKAYNKQIIYK
jgi:hypothetical protein